MDVASVVKVLGSGLAWGMVRIWGVVRGVFPVLGGGGREAFKRCRVLIGNLVLIQGAIRGFRPDG